MKHGFWGLALAEAHAEAEAYTRGGKAMAEAKAHTATFGGGESAFAEADAEAKVFGDGKAQAEAEADAIVKGNYGFVKASAEAHASSHGGRSSVSASAHASSNGRRLLTGEWLTLATRSCAGRHAIASRLSYTQLHKQRCLKLVQVYLGS